MSNLSKKYSLEKITMDLYFSRITFKMLSGEDMADIRVTLDGFWRVKAHYHSRGLGDLKGFKGKPDGYGICPMVPFVNPHK